MVLTATQSDVVHREAFIGSEEVKRALSLAKLFQPLADWITVRDIDRLHASVVTTDAGNQRAFCPE